MRVPTVNARSSLTPLRLPRGAQTGAGMGTALVQFGEHLGKVAKVLQDNQDELDLSRLEGEYNARVKELKAQVARDPNYLNHPKLFQDGIDTIQTDILGQTDRQPVSQALRVHINSTLPAVSVDVKTNALALMNKAQIADFNTIEDQLAARVAESNDPKERAEARARYKLHLDRMADRAIFDPVEKEKRQSTFDEKTQTRRMEHLRRVSRAELFNKERAGEFNNVAVDKRHRILEAARKDEEAEERRDTKTFKDVQEVVERTWSAQANTGSLSDADLEDALAGKHPYITPDKARQLANINANPPSGTGGSSVRAIMTEYHSGPSSIDRIQKYRKQLVDLHRQAGRPNKLLDDALDELQTDQRTEERTDAVNINKRAADAVKMYNEQVDPITFSVKQMMKNQTKREQLEVERRVKRGDDPKAVIEEIKARRQQQVDAIPDDTKSVLDAAQ